jgi:hypothetical protein
MAGKQKGEKGRRDGGAVLMLLLIPMLVLWVPFYNSVEPTLFGFPFFYWFQLAWIFVSMAVTALVYFATEPR